MTAGALVVGAQELEPKERLVLHSLVKLLDGGMGARLRFSDAAGECHVLFVPPHWRGHGAPPPVLVRVLGGAAPAGPDDAAEIRLTPPLRATNVLVALQAARQRLSAGAEHDRAGSLRGLYFALHAPLLVGERRRTVLPLSGGATLVIDWTAAMVHGAVGLEALLTGQHAPGEARRVTPADEAALAALPRLKLRDLLWALTQRVHQERLAAPELDGRYRLLRWPDASALRHPGYPLLSALFTTRTLTVAEACQASGAEASAVRWFLATALALGVAVREDAAAAAAPATPPTPARPASPGLLQRLREHLKLW